MIIFVIFYGLFLWTICAYYHKKATDTAFWDTCEQYEKDLRASKTDEDRTWIMISQGMWLDAQHGIKSTPWRSIKTITETHSPGPV